MSSILLYYDIATTCEDDLLRAHDLMRSRIQTEMTMEEMDPKATAQ